METKKNKKADLESKRPLFFQIGLMIAIALSILAFEWSTDIKDNDLISGIPITDYEEDMIQPTFVKKEIPPAPPVPIIALDLEIVDDLTDIQEPDLYVGDIEDFNFNAYYDAFPEEEEVPEETVFIAVSDMPTFNGGDLSAFHRYVQQHVEYPSLAQEAGIDGKVLVQFIVDKSGAIIGIEILRSVDPVLDDAVKKVLKEAPKWKPGEQFGKKVKVKFVMPVIFKLQ